MANFSAKQRKTLAAQIKKFKEKKYPGRGSGNRLAKDLGVSPQTLSYWINGAREPSSLQLHDMAGLFGVSVQELFGMGKVARINPKILSLDLIRDITNARIFAIKKKCDRKAEKKRLSTIKTLISKELEIRQARHKR